MHVHVHVHVPVCVCVFGACVFADDPPFSPWLLVLVLVVVVVVVVVVVLVVWHRYCAVYRSRVYYFASEENREAFVQTPRRFLRDHPSVLPSLFAAARLALVVVGPPRVGKTTLCTRIAQHLHVPPLHLPPQADALYNQQPRQKKQRLADNNLAAGYGSYDHGHGYGYGYR